MSDGADLWRELAFCVKELRSCHRELAELDAAIIEGGAEAYANSPETSTTGRKRDADLLTAPNRVEVVKLRGEIAALTETRDFLLAAITAGIDVPTEWLTDG